MSQKSLTNIYSLKTSTKVENSVITLHPCDYDSSKENNLANLSQNSIDSSELADDSDDEDEIIKEIYSLGKKIGKIDEKKGEITTS